jgi:hypothetical protein
MQPLNKIDEPAYGGKYVYHREPTLEYIKAFGPQMTSNSCLNELNEFQQKKMAH